MNRFVPLPAVFCDRKYPIMGGEISACVVCAVFLASAFTVRHAYADVAVAGNLVADLRPSGLSGEDNTTWANQIVGANSVGDFQRSDLGALTVASINGTFKGNPLTTNALEINDINTNTLASAMNIPAALTGNGTRSVEAWILPNDASSTQGVLSWGIRGSNNMMSRFSYNNGNFGQISGWFDDSSWTETLPVGDVHHVVWTYDGSLARGYIDGQLIGSATALSGGPMQTPSSLMYIGNAPDFGSSDAFHGFIAEVRVHTGVLNATQVLNNYDIGIEAPIGLGCDFNGDTACDSTDFTTLVNNLFTNGGKTAGDINLDGVIDLKDLRQFKDDPNRIVGTAGAGATSVATVPEPASIVFASLACIALASACRSRHS